VRVVVERWRDRFYFRGCIRHRCTQGTTSWVRIDGVGGGRLGCVITRNRKGGADRGAALVTTRALYARSVLEDGGDDGNVRRGAHLGIGNESRRRTRRNSGLHSSHLGRERSAGRQIKEATLFAQH
jgi:hypothetical protein